MRTLVSAESDNQSHQVKPDKISVQRETLLGRLCRQLHVQSLLGIFFMVIDMKSRLTHLMGIYLQDSSEFVETLQVFSSASLCHHSACK